MNKNVARTGQLLMGGLIAVGIIHIVCNVMGYFLQKTF